MAGRVPVGLSAAAQGRKFGFTVGGAFAVLAGIVWWRQHPSIAAAFGTVSGLLLAGAVVAPAALGPVEKAWMGLAHAISKVTTPIFMGVVWYLVITPIGILRRTIGRDPLVPESIPGSWWVDVSKRPQSSMARQF
jgi:hypothetical protein